METNNMTELMETSNMIELMETSNMTELIISSLETTDMSFTSSTIDPLTEVEAANRRFTNTLIPCIVYAAVLILVGIIGNSLVCYIFGFRLKRSAQNYFILFLAVFDLLSCTIGLPAEIVDMALHFKYSSAALCKIMRLINTFTALGSIFTLMIIAIDRYRRVRKPLKSQISNRHAKLSLIPISILSLFFSLPSLFVYGLRTVESGFPGITGLDCTISDEAKSTIVPLIYNSFLFLSFLILAASLIAMYSLILRSLKKHAVTLRKASVGTLSTGTESLPEPCSTTDNSTSTSRGTDFEKPLTQNKEEQFSNSSDNYAETSTNNDEKDETNGHRHNDELKVEAKNQQTIPENKSVSNEIPKTLRHSSSTNIDGHVNEAGGQPSLVLKEDDAGPTSESINNTTHNKTDQHNDNGLSSTNESTDVDIDDVSVHNLVKDCTTENEEHACYAVSNDNLKHCPTNNDIIDEYDNTHDKQSDFQTCSLQVPNQSTTDCEPGNENLKTAKVYDEPKNEDAPVSGDTTSHHVSFDVSYTTPNDTEKIRRKTMPAVLATVFNCKRRMSETPFLNRQEIQMQGYLNPTLTFKANEDVSHDDQESRKLSLHKHKKHERGSSKQRNITRKTTIIAFVVTLVFILSFVPHLCLQVAHLIKKGFDEKLEGAPLALYNTFLRSYFINNVANPIIYGLLNENFRTEVKLVLARLRCWKSR